MKKVTFKSIELKDSDPSAFQFTFKHIRSFESFDALKEEMDKIEKSQPKIKFDWKEILRGYMQSDDFGRKHPLKTIPQITTAMDAYKVVKENSPMTISVDDEVANLMKDAAKELAWIKMSNEVMPLAIEFKKYFEEL